VHGEDEYGLDDDGDGIGCDEETTTTSSSTTSTTSVLPL